MWKEVELEDNIQMYEFQKVICFISEDIITFEINDNKIRLQLLDTCDDEKIISKLISLSKQYIKKETETEETYDYINRNNGENYYIEIINNDEVFCNWGNGLISLKGKAIFLFRLFEKEFSKLADEMGAIPKLYPVLLPVEEYIKTGYIKRSPQYAIFCSNFHENMEELDEISLAVHEDNVSNYLATPHYALSPSACFHVYMEYKGKVLETKQTVSFTQNVFRNEGRLNYGETGRLKDYHVREIVFLGDEEYVQNAREEALKKTKYLLQKFEMEAVIQKASDPFVLPKMQKYRKIQLIDSSKYEVSFCIGEGKRLAAASFNYHGVAFTHPFNIGIKGCNPPVTGCVGFGIERWVIAFLSQFGTDEKGWPEYIKKEYQISNGKYN